jgi:cbb3-type cytochrome oxidase maturation protein
MNVLMLMIPISLLLSIGFLFAFLFVIDVGQMDDLETPAHRILDDDDGGSK